MASATGIQERPPSADAEPLLGGVEGATQKVGRTLFSNLILGTAVLAQAGIFLLTAVVWTSIFRHDLSLFSAHPLLNSVGILALTQSILILQPTHNPVQKRNGTIVHAALNSISFSTLIVGLVIIEYNKFSHNGIHFKSTHAILGFATYTLLVLQTAVGFTQFYTPSLYGSVANAKWMYKYHRMSGYILLIFLIATVSAATRTFYNLKVLGIQLWAVLATSALVLIGVIPRIKLQKLGWKSTPRSDTLRH